MEKKASRRPRSGHLEVVAGIAAGLVIAMLTVVSVQMISAKSLPPVPSAASNARAAAPVQRKAPHYASVRAGIDISPDARFVADWIADSGDAGNKQFVIIDKKGA